MNNTHTQRICRRSLVGNTNPTAYLFTGLRARLFGQGVLNKTWCLQNSSVATKFAEVGVPRRFAAKKIGRTENRLNGQPLKRKTGQKQKKKQKQKQKQEKEANRESSNRRSSH
tara:strand:+ start:129 stop:467 length:339 start_codon:yes stop_codon:yes gene_type:complete